MSQTNPREDKQAIASAFSRLLQDFQSSESKIATKEEEAEKSKNQQLLTKTLDYTVDNIVNGMAALQLSFGSVVNQLADNLSVESYKLEELQKAIAVEEEHLAQLNQVRLVADALHILHQEHQEKISTLQTRTTAEIEAINKEITQTKKAWQKEQQEFTIRIQESSQLLLAQREAEVADYQYELERQRTIENDEYDESKRIQTRELAEQKVINEQNWSERTKYLSDRKSDFSKYQEQIASFEAKLKEAYNQAKGQAIQEADRKYQIEAELKEKEWSAEQQGYEFKIESLTAVIERQNQQIAEINTQLQEVNTQAQNLALQAFS